MVRRRSGEAIATVPVRSELPKNVVRSDAQFTRFVTRSVAAAIRNGARSFADLLLELPSIYPTDVLSAVDRVRSLSGVDVDILDGIRADASTHPEGAAGTCSLLPLPHPLDYEWRFASRTCRELLVAASDMTRGGETILLYGTPGLAYAAISLPIRNRRVVFAGSDNAVTRRLKGLNRAAGSPITVVVGEGVQRACASAVFVDPPWYPDYIKPMFQNAAEACRSGAVVLVGLPPLGIRPGVAGERDAFDVFAKRQGFDRVGLEESVVGYETPFFEGNALAAAGVHVPVVWRRGDLALYRRRRGSEGSRAPGPPRECWVEVEIEGMRIRIRTDVEMPGSRQGLQSLVHGDVLPSVSRRDRRRTRANVWTSGNRIYRSGNPMAVLEAAYACRDGGVGGRARSLWRNLDEEDALAALVDQLRRIATLEAAEWTRFAGGSQSRFGRAA